MNNIYLIHIFQEKFKFSWGEHATFIRTNASSCCNSEIMTANISAISRLRIGVDGEGVTTLVVFMLCPLNCRYCLNPQTLSMSYPHKCYTAQELYDEVKIDGLYFLATGGGVTFGGGEPLLNASFINEFRHVCGPQWKINVETSLNIKPELLHSVIDTVDSFIIDIKDMNPSIYSGYTERDNSRVIENLKYIVKKGKTDSCVIKLPLIPGFNDEDDVLSSKSILEKMGYRNFNRLTYKTKEL